jgi:DNA polymerase elongation subunit (family B)
VFFCKFQQEVLEIMSKGNNIKEVKSLLPKVKDIYHKYVRLLKETKVPIDQLALQNDSQRILINIKTETLLRVMH